MTPRQSLRGADHIEEANSTANLFLGNPRWKWMPWNHNAPQPPHLTGTQNDMSSSVTATSTVAGIHKLPPHPPLAAAGPLISPVTPGANLPSSVEVSTLPQPNQFPASLLSPDPSTSPQDSPNVSHPMVSNETGTPPDPQSPQNSGTIPRENEPNDEKSASNLHTSSTPTRTLIPLNSHPASVQSIGNIDNVPSQGPGTVQADHPPSDDTLTEETWRRWEPKFAALWEQASTSTNLTFRRTMLLQMAYEKRDGFYLVLHQMFCRWSAHTLPAMLNSPAVHHGFQKLEGLLIANDTLPPELMSIFVDVPDTHENLMHAAWYRKILTQVSSCLALLAKQYCTFIDNRHRSGYYHARQFPPMAIELASCFHLYSPVFLKVIFASTCRLLYDPDKLPALELLFQEEMNLDDINSEQARHTTPLQTLVEKYKAIAMKPFGSSPQPPSQGITASREHTSPSILPVVPDPRQSFQVPIQQTHQQSHPASLQQPASLPTQAQTQNTSQWAQTVQMHNAQIAQTHSAQMHQIPQIQQDNYGPAYQSALQPNTAHSPGPPRGYFSVSQPPSQGPSSGQQTVNPNHFSMGQAQVPPPIHHSHGRHIVSQTPHQLPQKPSTPLLPPPGYKIPPTLQPNPMRLGLHQADLRDPIKKLKHWGPNGFVDVGELFYYLDGFVMAPAFMGSEEISFSRTFEISALDKRSAPLLEASTHHPARPATCIYQPGCRSIRLRAIAVSNSHKDKVFDRWPTESTSWPSVFYIHVNGKELFVRRKSHNGKDLPLDITPYLVEGENKLSLHFLLEPGECKNFRYVFGIERMQTLDFDRVRNQACTIPASDTRQSIKKRLSSSGEDDDLTVVSESLTVSLIDPFMAQIFKTPARSVHCEHLECFDLDTFIMTRKSESGPAAMNDNWQCPICKADARPMNLVIDEFFVNIRDELVSSNRLEENVVAIDVRADGSWTVKVVSDENTSFSQTMPGSNKRKASEPLNIEASRQRQQSSPVNNREQVVIELD